MGELFEAAMVISFGASWPLSILKAWRSRTAKGKSAAFSALVLFGYACGILSKIVSGNITYVFIFYVINFFAVMVDLALYVRNSRLDAQRQRDELPG